MNARTSRSTANSSPFGRRALLAIVALVSIAAQAPVEPTPAQPPIAEPFGRLEVKVEWLDLWAGTSEPAPGVGVRVTSGAFSAPHAFPWEAITDADARATFERLPVGFAHVSGDRAGRGSVEIAAGETAHLVLLMRIGRTVTGRVKTHAGEPAAQAEVVLFGHVLDDLGARIATADAEGRFSISNISEDCYLSARNGRDAPSSHVKMPRWAEDSAEIELVLGERGGDLEGRVTGPDGKPVPHAAACLEWLSPPILRRDSSWRVTHTDADGRFELHGLEAGEARLVVISQDLAPHKEDLVVSVDANASRSVKLGLSATVQGTVVNSRGQPTSYATVWCGEWSSFLWLRTTPTRDGRFVLRGLPTGNVVLDASGVKRTFDLSPGEVATWDIELPHRGDDR